MSVTPRRAILALVCASAFPLLIAACASKSTYEGGGRAFTNSTSTVPDDDSGSPPVDTGVDTAVIDTFVPPDTGNKDSGTQG